jgi:hypothetical protein
MGAAWGICFGLLLLLLLSRHADDHFAHYIVYLDSLLLLAPLGLAAAVAACRTCILCLGFWLTCLLLLLLLLPHMLLQ